ncbi:MAG TPA: hypothetical protein P5207_01650, partial [Candidatus Sabulitectum sp.]|nr:hypothetical protein [Candidatus Sabulitectum sp.]
PSRRNLPGNPRHKMQLRGRVLCFNGAVKPPSGKTGLEVLEGLASAMGVAIPEDIPGEIAGKLGEMTPFYWNTGEERNWSGKGKLIPGQTEGRAPSIQPPFTHSQDYRREIREVGTERYRVH